MYIPRLSVIGDRPITPDQLDLICDLYLDIYQTEPGRKKLNRIGRMTERQARAKAAMLLLRSIMPNLRYRQERDFERRVERLLEDNANVQ